jgi:cysteine-rich repeat protein
VAPGTISPGGSVDIDYVVLFADGVEIEARASDQLYTVLPRSASLDGSLAFGPINEQLTVTLRAFRGQQVVGEDRIVIVEVVNPTDPKIEFFTATPASIQPGEGVRLEWRVVNATSVRLVNEASSQSMDVAAEGFYDTSLGRTTTFRLVAEGSGKNDEAEVTVDVVIVDPPSIDDFGVVGTPVPNDVPTVLYWSTQLSDAVQIDDEGGSRILTSETPPEALAGAWLFGSSPGFHTYTLTAFGPAGGPATASVLAEKLARTPDAQLALRQASPRFATPGAQLFLQWDSGPPSAQIVVVSGGNWMSVAGNSYSEPLTGLETREVVVYADAGEGGIAEARHTAFQILPEQQVGGQAPIDGHAVMGAVGGTTGTFQDNYTVFVDEGSSIDVSLEQGINGGNACDPNLGLQVVDAQGTALPVVIDARGCPRAAATYLPEGPLSIEVFIVNGMIGERIEYVLVPDEKPAPCGDGIQQPNESCDDHNRRPNDGCDGYCQLEIGFDYGVAQLTDLPLDAPPDATTLRHWRSLFGSGGPLEDEAVAVIPLPAGFPFYGRTYYGAAIYTNGFISFLPGDPSNLDTIDPLADGSPEAVISVFGTDLVMPPTGKVVAWADEATGSVSIEYRNFAMPLGAGVLLDGRITLEPFGTIRVDVLDVMGSDASPSIHIGIESPINSYRVLAPDCDPSCSADDIKGGPSYQFFMQGIRGG